MADKQLFEINTLLRDKNFRADLQANPEQHASKLGYQLNDEQKVNVVINTTKRLYLVVPDTNSVNTDSLTDINAAGSAATVSTFGSVSSLASISGSLSSIGTATSAGSASTSGPTMPEQL